MVSRPPLPKLYANPFLKKVDESALPPVKYQILTQGKDILVGRLKIETPTDSGHAFILRRFDTGAVSLTTMFRAAFPKAPEDDEKREIQWVKENYDLTGNNGSSRDAHIPRLAGIWVDTSLAMQLGQEYSMGALINVVINAEPDPNGQYRRSGKPAAAGKTAVPPPPQQQPPAPAQSIKAASPVKPAGPFGVSSLPTPSPKEDANPPAKRRKESSPIRPPTSSSSMKPPSRASPAPSSKAPPTPRRSARTKSPAPAKVAPSSSVTTASRSPKITRSTVVVSKKRTVVNDDIEEVDEENVFVQESMAGSELREQDIKEQQSLIADLKSKRRGATKREVEEESEDDMQVGESSSAVQKKRSREEDEKPLTFEFKEPEVQERQVITNRRVNRFQLEPRTKSFAWGVAAFAVGMGAVTFLPNFF